MSGKYPLLLSADPNLVFVVANLNAFAFDWVARQKVGGTDLAMFVMKQLPVLPPAAYDRRVAWGELSLGEWLRPYLAELVFTAWDVQPFATALGWIGSPFAWNPERRVILRAELDAAYFHLYGLTRPEVEHILDSFPIVQRNELRIWRLFRSRALILDTYDAMAVATPERPFMSRLVPGPGDPAVAHPPRSGESQGRWVPWADVERPVERGAVPARDRRPARREELPASVPPTLFPARPAEPGVLYPEAAPARRRAAESTAPAPATRPSQGTLADLSRATAASADWLPEETVDAASVVPGRRVRHTRFGKGVVIEVRRTVKPPTVTIRFGASDDREVAIGYGLIEFEAEQQ